MERTKQKNDIKTKQKSFNKMPNCRKTHKKVQLFLNVKKLPTKKNFLIITKKTPNAETPNF